MPSESNLVELHSELLILLEKFHQFCVRHDIHYTLHGGSLLGAVREKGFIPWDDDLDVSLTREEYQKLLREVKDGKLNELLEFHDEISNIPTILMRRENKPTVWIDIFIYDYISEKKICQRLKNAGLLVLMGMMKTRATMEVVKVKNAQKYTPVQYACYYMTYTFGRLFPIKMKAAWLNWFSQHAFVGHKTLIHRANDDLPGRWMILPSSVMQEYQFAPFETIETMISSRYHEILVSTYGEDYMIPKKDAGRSYAHAVARIKLKE